MLFGMNDPIFGRSPELMSPDDTALLVVDVQEKLIPLLPEHKRLVWNIRRLLDGAKALGVPALVTEQYPQGLGGTVAELAERLPAPASKVAFSCAACEPAMAALAASGAHRVLICGIESHVCVQQTALDLIAAGYRVYLAVDAMGARHAVDHDTALRRMEISGATLTTTEAALFEWCRQSGTPQFKEVSRLVRETPPV
jgi:nicotinamidase-related amidase